MTRRDFFLTCYWFSFGLALMHPNRVTRALNLTFLTVGLGWMGWAALEFHLEQRRRKREREKGDKP